MEGFTTSDSSDSELQNSCRTIDFSRCLMDKETVQKNLEVYINDENKKAAENIEYLLLSDNRLNSVPECVSYFSSLRVLDISGNGLSSIPDILVRCSLTSLIAKNNNLDNESLPKSFGDTIKELNLSGNNLTDFPGQVLEMVNLKYLYLGGNRIESLPKDIQRISGLRVLSLGGNRLSEVPESLGLLSRLQVLVLSDNLLETLPPAIANLKYLKSLLLHRNKLRTLPPEIVALKGLSELSLRDNPLVVSFVCEMTHTPPSLLECAARVVKHFNVPYALGDLPISIIRYLESAHHCVNPKCKGVYFDNRVEHIKFVDFCGKYRIPLLQYLCSSKCVAGYTTTRRSSDHPMMKKVLLG